MVGLTTLSLLNSVSSLLLMVLRGERYSSYN